MMISLGKFKQIYPIMAEGKIKISVETQQAIQNVTKLEDSFKEVTKEADESQKKYNDSVSKQARASEKVIQANKKQVTSLKVLRREEEILREGREKSTNLKDIKQYNRALKSTQKEIGKLTGETNKFAKFAKRAFVFLGGGALLKKSIDVIRDYEQSIADLGSILGVTGDDLDFFKDKSLELSKSTLNSSKDVVEAFKLVGSAQPELLKNRDALAEVTKQALILANASGLEVNEAVKSLTGSLNQFNLGAEDSGKAIDILAAGSKAGAVEIPQLAEGLKNFGAVANANNVTLAESVALQEVLGEKQIEGAQAGTNLRNIILKLANAGKGFVDGQFDINEALTQTKSELDAIEDPIKRNQELTKLFGLESVTAGQVLLDNIDTFEEYTVAVDENGVAQEQANQRLNTINGAYKFLQISIQNYVLGVNEATGAQSFLAKGLQFLGNNINLVLNTTLALVGAFTTYSVITKTVNFIDNLRGAITAKNTILQRAYTKAVNLSSKSVKIFGKSIKALPLLAIIAGLIAIGKAVYDYTNRLTNAEKAQKNLNKVLKEAEKATAKEKSELKELLKIAKDETRAKEDREKAIKRLNDISPEYLGNITTENINTAEGTTAIDNYIDALDRKAKAQAIANAKQKIFQERLEIETRAGEELVGVTKQIGSLASNIGIGDLVSLAKGDFITTETLVNTGEELQKSFDKEKEALLEANKAKEKAINDFINSDEELKKVFEEGLLDPVNNPNKPTTGKSKKQLETEEANRIRLKAESDLLKQIEKLTEDSAKVKRQLELDELTGEERLQKEREFALEEIQILEDTLLKKNAEIEKDSEKRVANQIKIINSISELTDEIEIESQKKIDELRQENAEKELERKRNALGVEKDIISEEISLLEAKLELNNEDENAKSEIDLLNQKLALIDQEIEKQKELIRLQLEDKDLTNEQRQLLNLKIDSLDLEGQKQKKNINEAIGELSKTKTLEEKFDSFLGDLFGVSNPEQVDAIKNAFSTLVSNVTDIYSQGIQSQIDSNQKLIDGYNDNISELEGRLEKEKQLQEDGNASNVDLVEQQLADEKEQRDLALAEQEELTRKKQQLESIQQLASLVTASANIFQSLSGFGPFGIAIAIATIASMFGAFASAKAKASQNTQFAKGDSINTQQGSKVIKGKRHSNGGEMLLDHAEIEGGESLNILNRNATAKDFSRMAELTKYLNNGGRFEDYFSLPKLNLKRADVLLENSGVNNIFIKKSEDNAKELKKHSKILTEILNETKGKQSLTKRTIR